MQLVVMLVAVAFATLACVVYLILAVGQELTVWLTSHRKEQP